MEEENMTKLSDGCTNSKRVLCGNLRVSLADGRHRNAAVKEGNRINVL